MKITLADIDDPRWAHYSLFVLEEGVYWDVYLHYDQRNVGAMVLKPKPTSGAVALPESASHVEFEFLVRKYKEMIQNLWYPDEITELPIGNSEDGPVTDGVLLIPAYKRPRYSERVWCGITFYGQSVPLTVRRLELFKEGVINKVRAERFVRTRIEVPKTEAAH